MLYTLCIGSNRQKAANMALAHRRLVELFPDIRFAAEMQTFPIGGLSAEAMFVNQVARFHSAISVEELTPMLKAIEQEAGRLPGDKAKGIVKLDIDLLAADNRIFKPEDWKRDYVQWGLSQLSV